MANKEFTEIFVLLNFDQGLDTYEIRHTYSTLSFPYHHDKFTFPPHTMIIALHECDNTYYIL